MPVEFSKKRAILETSQNQTIDRSKKVQRNGNQSPMPNRKPAASNLTPLFNRLEKLRREKARENTKPLTPNGTVEDVAKKLDFECKTGIQPKLDNNCQN